MGLKSNGSVVAWGKNDFGQCDVPQPNEGFIAIAGGGNHNVGLKSDGTIVAWGANDYGQCDVPQPNEDFVGIAAGYMHSLGLKSDGTIVAWGDNSTYQQCSIPEPNENFVTIETGWYHNFGVMDNIAPVINSIADIDGDQGGWVRIEIEKSLLDGPPKTKYPISTYNVWQRIDITDEELFSSEKLVKENIFSKSDIDDLDLSGLPLQTENDCLLLKASDLSSSNNFPDGTWELVGSFAACQQDQYLLRASTLADSTADGINYSVYAVSAHSATPMLWFISEPDSGYSIDNLAPGVPENFSISYTTGVGNQLSWNECQDEDFQYFRVYRSTQGTFEVSQSNLVHSTINTEWMDNIEKAWKYYYRITAIDHNGNESEPTLVESPVATVLQSYSFSSVDNGFEISWTLSEVGNNMDFLVYREL